MEKERKYDLRGGLQLRQVGSRYMVVVADDVNVNLTEVYRLNESAARLWQRLEAGGASAPELTDWLAELYQVAPEQVADDVNRQLAEWRSFGLLVEQPMEEGTR